MRIGICTVDFPTMPARALFEKCANLGFESMQFGFTAIEEANFKAGPEWEIPAEISPEVIALIRDLAAEYKIDIVAINGTFNMAHPDPAVRAEGVRRFAILADAAVALGCPILSLCTGTRNLNSMWRAHEDNLSDEAWADCKAVLLEICAIAEKRGLTLAVETEARNVVQTIERARKMLDEVNSPALKMIMDCANLFLPGTARPENVEKIIRSAFDVYGKDVVRAHGKDILADEQISFCATGKGIVDYDLFLQLLREYNYAGDMILHGIYDESDMPRAIEFMRDKIEGNA